METPFEISRSYQIAPYPDMPSEIKSDPLQRHKYLSKHDPFAPDAPDAPVEYSLFQTPESAIIYAKNHDKLIRFN